MQFHDLRHTAATRMAENDTPEATMKALLGHVSQQMISGILTSAMPPNARPRKD